MTITVIHNRNCTLERLDINYSYLIFEFIYDILKDWLVGSFWLIDMGLRAL